MIRGVWLSSRVVEEYDVKLFLLLLLSRKGGMFLSRIKANKAGAMYGGGWGVGGLGKLDILLRFTISVAFSGCKFSPQKSSPMN